MLRYIKSSIALQKIDKAVNDYAHHDDVLQLFSDLRCAIIEAPTADVQEVIYCKNCKNYLKFENGDVVCEEFGGYIKDNDFCSRGERKDGKD